ncbi:hypothetical protein [Streptomyces fuscichromogenes]|uniref:Uncharacterized protein n=1 Tax=Streptomyces fuscichromogenes TaxID=1324013 RepID=A0A917XIF1_9ACTN|nr:hypothetical protein [Streptomyces fuscichromogenes]GGN28959.1 hypothetical protein GCM10011578_065290 [Streptomyces fuscichromogenes]
MALGDGQTVDEQFARLPRSRQRELEEKGLGLPRLRDIALEEGGELAVRHILAEHSRPTSRWDFDGDRRADENRAVWPWIRLLLAAVIGVVLCLLSTYVLRSSALFVGAACGAFVAWAGFRTRRSLGGLVACGLVAVAYVALIWTGSYAADEWYLHVRGQETTVTYAKPLHEQASHGVRVTYCRVTLPDGTVRRVFLNDKRCTDENMVGTRTPAVIDPSDHYRPVLGDKSAIGGTAAAYVCLGAAAVLVLAPVSAAVMSRANERRGRQGEPGGRVGGADV